MPRPAPVRRTVRREDRPTASPVRRNRLTGRAAVLAAVCCVLAVAVVYPLRQFLAQRSDIHDLRRTTERQRADVTAMRQELQHWQDPDYVRRQAREQLHYVLPGDTSYVVMPPSPQPGPSASATPAPDQWYDRLWTSMQQADHAPTPGASPSAPPAPASTPPTPATEIGGG